MRQDLCLQGLLEEGLAQFDLCHLAPVLKDYLELLDKWNAAYNLTAIKDKQGMVTKHIVDSLAITPWLRGKRVIDVGTGAGLPGIPLALAQPEIEFYLLDSNGKKIRFLTELKHRLPLNNVTLVQSRVENYHPKPGFDTVISRAFSSIEQMLSWTRHLLVKDGLWLAMKGQHPENTLDKLPYPYEVKEYTVQGLEGARCGVFINNTIKESPWQK